MKKRLRLILHIEPWGFSKGQTIGCKFTDRKSYVPCTQADPPLYALTRGEGQALQFVLEDTDLSCGFAKALDNGEFLEFAKDWERGEFQMHYVPKGKRVVLVDEKPEDFMNDMMENLKTLDDALDEALESGRIVVEKKGGITEIIDTTCED